MAVQFMRIESKIWIEVPRHHSTLRLYTTNCLFSSDSSVHPGGHKQSCGPCSENRYSTQLEESVEDNQIYQFLIGKSSQVFDVLCRFPTFLWYKIPQLEGNLAHR